MKLNNIEHVFFDLDHTLWDFDKNSELAFGDIFKKWNLGLGVQDFLKVYSSINLKYWELYRNNKVSKEVLRYGRLKDSFDILNFEANDDLVNSLADDYIEYLPKNNHLLLGTVEILEYLKSSYKIHIITNGFEEVQRKKMATSGILEYFHTITTSEEAGVKKPHSLIFKKALEKSAASAENSVMIGDNYEADIIGAENAGLHSIYFDYHQNTTTAAMRQIKTLKELIKFL
ncbi:YjjG family noncanonical pyrimidine nucleotidase [Zunongwangia sp. F363]|uniref:YjjG family noncanonical pyrimidine nucleotidase n=1 Tax=Autumnicola tepida TaxID=3075595 RepID=A0ABU3CER2_9FLAO|nr:YjjG family noncanonical pyrimidine nucleotidase [Zunongwangia sp. F363]MDT0644804.1 YjjG family noncanonical pyrimidine nucleotidase [Zunongwangia sp. F363]